MEISKQSEIQKVAKIIRHRIASGMYQQHSYLPAERSFAEELGTSRNTLRAALENLRIDKLVLKSPGRGVRVLPPTERLTTNLIGVIYQSWQTTPPEIMYMLQGIQDTLAHIGQRFEIKPISSRITSDILSEDLSKQYGAMIFVETFGLEKEVLALEEKKIPVVVANLKENIDISATYIDHESVTYTATKTLASMGNKRIAYLGRDFKVLFYGKSYSGYRKAIQDAGLAYDESLIAICKETDCLSAYFATRKLLDSSTLPNAIVATRDVLAKGACAAIEEKGLIIGKDISIIGYDDVTWPHPEPFLTTFHEPCHKMGAMAAEMLIDKIVNGWQPPVKRKLDAPFILRKSAGLCVRELATEMENNYV